MNADDKRKQFYPIIRIKKIELENFKNIRKGVITLNNGREFYSQDRQPDILGIYGQNGSGKTAVIDAIGLLKYAMSGKKIPDKYSDCIMCGTQFAKLSFTFDYYQEYEDGALGRELTYTFKLSAVEKTEEDRVNSNDPVSFDYSTKSKIFEEKILASGEFEGVSHKKQVIICSSENGYPIGPARKIKYYVGEKKDVSLLDLSIYKREAEKGSTSFIFKIETLELFKKYPSEYLLVLLELNIFAHDYLVFVDSYVNGAGIFRIQLMETLYGSMPLNLIQPTSMGDEQFNELVNYVERTNIVLPAIVPNLKLVIEDNKYTSDGEAIHKVRIFSKRGNSLLPLRDESAGILKIISIMLFLIYAFNDVRKTVAIDELDAGIYEYLLGEILSIFEIYGKGQLIFTSHNLRPLELLNKESILFTTTNQDNRFVRLKGVGRTNNLRNLYLREIISSSQDEHLYNAAKRQKLIASFMKAGNNNGKQ